MIPRFYKQGCTDRQNTNVHPVCLRKQPSGRNKTSIISSLKTSSEKHCIPCISQSYFVSFALLWHKWALKPADNTDHLTGRDKRSHFLRRQNSSLVCLTTGKTLAALDTDSSTQTCEGCNHYLLHYGKKVQMSSAPSFLTKNCSNCQI